METLSASVNQTLKLGKKIAILTGDNKRVGEAIAKQLGIDYVLAEILPQEKSAEILKLKDPKEIMTMFSAHALQEASAGVVAYQAKVNSVLRKSHHELIEMTDSAIEHAKERLNDLVNEASAKAPTGSEAFTASFKAAFEAALQGFDQVRSSVHTAYANLEKSADSALNSNEHVVQTAAKARKAIAAS